MYFTSWQHTSRSSHPNLWAPPIAPPMNRGAVSETGITGTREYSEQLRPPGRGIRLPSVDEILFRIQTHEGYSPEHPLDAQSIPISFKNAHQTHSLPNLYVAPQRRETHAGQSSAVGRIQFGDYIGRNAQQAHGRASDIQFVVQGIEQHRAGSQHGALEPMSTGRKRGRKKKLDTICSHCLSTSTPEWRKGPDGSRTLCNACGLFYSKLAKKFGAEDANMIFAFKRQRDEVQDRVVPTTQQKNRIQTMMQEQVSSDSVESTEAIPSPQMSVGEQ